MTSVVARFNAPICKYHVDIMYPQFSISDFDAVALTTIVFSDPNKQLFHYTYHSISFLYFSIFPQLIHRQELYTNKSKISS